MNENVYYYLLKDVYYGKNSLSEDEEQKLYIRIILQSSNNNLSYDNLSNYIPQNKEIIVILKNENNKNDVVSVKTGDGIHSITQLPNVNWYEYNLYDIENQKGLQIEKKELGQQLLSN